MDAIDVLLDLRSNINRVEYLFDCNTLLYCSVN